MDENDDDREDVIWDWSEIPTREKREYLGTLLSLAFLFLVLYTLRES
jgi:hypothetical protein